MRVRCRWSGPKPAFVYPIPPAPRTAVLVPGFQSGSGVRVFGEGWSDAVTKFAPQAIAATLGQFEAIAATGISVSHAVIVLSRWRAGSLRDARVSEADRDMLWNWFRVPVFEQIVAEGGMLLAAECEAHYGLHIECEAMRERWSESDLVDESVCACGRTTVRLISKEVAAREHAVRSVAAQAR